MDLNTAVYDVVTQLLHDLSDLRSLGRLDNPGAYTHDRLINVLNDALSELLDMTPYHVVH